LVIANKIYRKKFPFFLKNLDNPFVKIEQIIGLQEITIIEKYRIERTQKNINLIYDMQVIYNL
jgi:hypothetical protein